MDNNKNIGRIKKICWIFLILALCINMLSVDVYLPAMSFMTSELSTTPFMLKLVFILNFLEFSIAPLIWGSFSDIKGRRLAVFVCLILSVFGQFLSALSPNIYFLMIFRVIQYLGAGALSSIILALICDNFEGHKRAKAIALFEMSLPLAVAFGPFLGAMMLETLGWRGAFLIFTGIQGVCLIGVYFTLPKFVKIEKDIKIKDTAKGLWGILKDSVSMRIIAILGLAEGAWMIFTISSAFFYLRTFNLSLSVYSYYQSAPILFFLVGLAVYRLLINKLGITKLFSIGLLGYISLGLVFFFMRNGIISPMPLSLSCLMSLMTFFCGFVGPSGNALVLARVDEKLIGTSAATITSIINLIVGGSMFCGGYLIGSELSNTFFDVLLFIVFFLGFLCFTLRGLSKDLN